MKNTLSVCGITDIGLRRSNNEDSFVTNSNAGFCLVADGMGGAAAGEVASKIFTDTATQIIQQTPHLSEQDAISLVKETFLTANTKIRQHVLQTPNHRGMGCTADLLLFYDCGFMLGHIGDSRTYRMRQGQLVCLTKDHSLVQDQLDQGIISKDEARTHRLRNVISRAVGASDELEVDIIRGRYFAGDLFLLCSDGLTDMISEETIETTINNDNPLLKRANLLIDQAKAGGGRDNITVVLVEVKI